MSDSWRVGYHENVPLDPITLRKLRRWVRAEPSNPVARAYLAYALSSEGCARDACRERRAAIRLWRGRSQAAIAGLWEEIAAAEARLGDRRTAHRAYGLAAGHFRAARRSSRVPVYREDLKMREAVCRLFRGRSQQGGVTRSTGHARSLRPRVLRRYRGIPGGPPRHCCAKSTQGREGNHVRHCCRMKTSNS